MTMTVRERIDSDYLREVKAQNASAVSTLRMLRAALKNAEIDKRGPLTEEEDVELIGREVKKLRDAIESYRVGGRNDLAESAEAEIVRLSAYLPTQLTEDELRAIISEKLAALGEVTVKDFGRVMGEVTRATKGRADGGQVSALVKSMLKGD